MKDASPETTPPTAWRAYLRGLAVVLGLAALAVFVYALQATDAMALARGARPVGSGDWWWMPLPLVACSAVLAWARVGGIAFLLASVVAVLALASVVSSLRDARAALHPHWLYESVGFGSVLLWPAMAVVLAAALLEWRARRRARMVEGSVTR